MSHFFHLKINLIKLIIIRGSKIFKYIINSLQSFAYRLTHIQLFFFGSI